MVLVPSFPCVPEVTFGISGAAVVFLLAIMPPLPFRATYAPWSRRAGVTRPAVQPWGGGGWLVRTCRLLVSRCSQPAGRGRPSVGAARLGGATCRFLAPRCLQLAAHGNGARFGGKADRYGRFLARLTAVALKRRDSSRTKMFDQGFCWRLAGFSRFGPLMWCHNGHSCQKATTAVSRAMSSPGGQPVRAKVPMAVV